MNTLFLRSLIIGISIAAPVGPIAILSIQRTLAKGWWMGLLTGLGAATADAIYGCIAGFGLTWASSFLTSHPIWLRLVGGLFLCYLGVKTLATRPAKSEQAEAAQAEAESRKKGSGLNKGLDKGPDKGPDKGYRGLMVAYFSTVFLTLTNPMTILAFTAVFAGLGLGTGQQTYGSAIVLVAGVFTGSALWWLGLSSAVSLLRSQFTPRRLQGVNRISGLILLVFGIIALSSIRSL